jgi:dimeric dUTPase (all-alpha-NTP-PPase superfamily)
MDRLEEIFTRQQVLQEKTYRAPLGFMAQSPDVQAEYVRTSVLAATAELHEALNEVGWKPWATERFYNTDNVISECVDAFHFVINIMLASGVSAKDLADRFHEKYVEKNERNATRQKEGYDGVSSKCPHCSRALDDVGVNQGRILDELVFVCGGCNKGLDAKMIIGKESVERIVRISKILDQTA